MNARRKQRMVLTAVGWIPLGTYVRGVKLAKANPDAEFKHGLTCWWACTGREIVQQFREGMHQRITEGVPYGKRGIREAE